MDPCLELVLVPVITYVIAALNTRSSTASFFLSFSFLKQKCSLSFYRETAKCKDSTVAANLKLQIYLCLLQSADTEHSINAKYKHFLTEKNYTHFQIHLRGASAVQVPSHYNRNDYNWWININLVARVVVWGMLLEKMKSTPSIHSELNIRHSCGIKNVSVNEQRDQEGKCRYQVY